MDLVTVLNVIEEKVCVCQVEHHLFHLEAQLDDAVCVLNETKNVQL